MSKPRALSLFSGLGGLDLGFTQVGFQVVEHVEIDSRFSATLRRNSSALVRCMDIRDYDPSLLNVDFILGGPPCQTFSAAGRRASGASGINDARGALFREYVRILKVLNPRGFLFENVYGIQGTNGGEAWRQIQRGFAESGYRLSWRILDAADYGVPQHRERMFIVGTKDESFRFPRPTHGPDSIETRPFVTAQEAIADASVTETESSARVNGKYGGLLEQIPPGLNYSFFTEKMGHPRPLFAWRSKFSDFLYKADPERPVRTLKAQGGQYTGPFHWDNRPFGIAELKRLQSIPDDYEIVGARQVAIHQIGNSVPPLMAHILARAVLDQLFDVEDPSLNYLSEEEQIGFRSRKRALTDLYHRKAKQAIDSLCVDTIAETKERTSRRILTDDFDWIEGNSGEGAPVTIKRSRKRWLIKLGLGKPAFEVKVSPVQNRPWPLPCDSVILQGSTLGREHFTGVWKAFEEELIRSQIKEDIVQLCGSYQYPP